MSLRCSAVPDVFVVGGGPAGLACAIAARRRGLRVTVADGMVPPADKACGEGLLPDTLRALEEIGVQIPAADSFAFRGIRFWDRDVTVAADFPAGAGRGVRRTVLHRLLVEHAEAAGVDLQWGARVDFDAIRARWMVGADGEGSLVRKWAGLDARLRDRQRFGFRRHYRIAPWSDYMELYWGEGCQVYVTPVSRECVCVAGISRDPRFRLDDALRGFPALAARLSGCEVMSGERGGPSFSRRLRAVWRDRVALAGDASGSVDAITGEGLSLAFRQAWALADAMVAGDLSAYARRHREIARRPEWMSRALLALGDYGSLRAVAMRGMAAAPWSFAQLLAVHVGGMKRENFGGRAFGDCTVGVRAAGDAHAGSGSDAG